MDEERKRQRKKEKRQTQGQENGKIGGALQAVRDNRSLYFRGQKERRTSHRMKSQKEGGNEVKKVEGKKVRRNLGDEGERGKEEDIKNEAMEERTG